MMRRGGLSPRAIGGQSWRRKWFSLYSLRLQFLRDHIGDAQSCLAVPLFRDLRLLAVPQLFFHCLANVVAVRACDHIRAMRHGDWSFRILANRDARYS